MKKLTFVVLMLGLVMVLAPARANAQARLTQPELQELTAELGSVLRFRQLGDVAPIGKGRFDVGVHYAAIDDRSNESPRVVGRIGISDRVDIGVWGGFDHRGNYGLAGGDVKIALMTQSPSRPVSIAIRPSVTSSIAADQAWVGNASIDISASRTFGAWSPYVGVGTSGSIGMERSKDVVLDYATANTSFAYAGISYRWRSLGLSAEVDSAERRSYAFRVSTRF